MSSNNDIESAVPVKPDFQDVAEGQKWAIRYGAEPFDFHFSGKHSLFDRLFESNDITAGPGGIANHNYVEIGIINDKGEFETLKRVQALGLEPDKNGNLEMLGGGRLIGFVIDGQHTGFDQDLIQRDDPHATKPNQLQHADKNGWGGGGYTKIVFEGTEREVLQLYGAMIRGTIEMNNQGPDFGLFGGENPNSNGFNAEMKEKITQMAGHLGLTVEGHNAGGIDFGLNPDMLDTQEAAPVARWESIHDLRTYIDNLEIAAAEQWCALKSEGIDVKLETALPNP